MGKRERTNTVSATSDDDVRHEPTAAVLREYAHLGVVGTLYAGNGDVCDGGGLAYLPVQAGG